MADQLQTLLDKIYQDSVLKGQNDADEFIKEAKKKAHALIEDAKKEAQDLRSKTDKELEELRRNVSSEIQLASRQAISSLKSQIIELIIAKATHDSIKNTFTDPKTLTAFIQTILEHWRGDPSKTNLELILPETLKKDLEKIIRSSLTGALKENLKITFSKAIQGGFQIQPEGKTYKISFTDEDFEEFLKQFLRPKTKKFLFEE